MTPKTAKKIPDPTNDIKTTIIIVLCVIIGIQALMLSQLLKKAPAPSATTLKPAPKRVPAPVQPAPVPLPKPVVIPEKPAKPTKKETPGSAGKIAFVLDDWGYNMTNCKVLNEITEPLAIAVLPNLRHTDEIAECAHSAGKVVMLHLPLEPYFNNDRYPDDYLITSKMRPARVEQLLEDSINKLPYAQGVNNHMGSKAMEHKPLMKLIFKHLKKRKLFFVDSMTSPHHSIGAETAGEMQLAFAQRDVFLDNINVREKILKQIEILADKARSRGYAIAIGHDRALTMRILKEEIPRLEAEGFDVVSITELLKNR